MFVKFIDIYLAKWAKSMGIIDDTIIVHKEFKVTSLDYLYLTIAKKNNIKITSPIEETTKSVNALSNNSVCSKYSNNKKTLNSENAEMAQINFFSPVFLYAEIDREINNTANTEPIA